MWNPREKHGRAGEAREKHGRSTGSSTGNARARHGESTGTLRARAIYGERKASRGLYGEHTASQEARTMRGKSTGEVRPAYRCHGRVNDPDTTVGWTIVLSRPEKRVVARKNLFAKNCFYFSNEIVRKLDFFREPSLIKRLGHPKKICTAQKCKNFS